MSRDNRYVFDDLLVLHLYREIAILPPAQFLESLHDPDLVRPELFRFVQYAATPAEAARLVLVAAPQPQPHAAPARAS